MILFRCPNAIEPYSCPTQIERCVSPPAHFQRCINCGLAKLFHQGVIETQSLNGLRRSNICWTACPDFTIQSKREPFLTS